MDKLPTLIKEALHKSKNWKGFLRELNSLGAVRVDTRKSYSGEHIPETIKVFICVFMANGSTYNFSAELERVITDAEEIFSYLKKYEINERKETNEQSRTRSNKKGRP